jgi:putative intracellular protease/amidase
MEVAIVLFEKVTATDLIGPYEVLSRLPGAVVRFVATTPGVKRTDVGFLGLSADYALGDVRRPDIVVVPGGPGQVRAMDDAALLDWLRAVHETTTWTTSVCSGSLLLGKAGLLRGKRATSNWAVLEELRAFGATPTDARVVFDGKLVTGAGVTAGIDMALTLAARIAGEPTAQAIQLGIEYDPEPPFDTGSPEKAPPEMVEMVRAFMKQEGEAAAAR